MTALWLAIVASACGNTTTGPAPQPAANSAVVPNAPAPTHTFVTLRLSGTLSDDQDAPVPGATITLRSSGIGAPVTVSTDAAGFFTTPVDVDTFYAPPLAWVSIRRNGYEDLENVAIFTGLRDTTANFITFRRTPIPAGAEVTLRAAFNGPLCGFDLEYPCRHVLVTVPGSGTLVLETKANASGSYYFGPISYPVAGITRQSLAVTAGQGVPIELLWNPAPMPFAPDRSATFTLTTSLQP